MTWPRTHPSLRTPRAPRTCVVNPVVDCWEQLAFEELGGDVKAISLDSSTITSARAWDTRFYFGRVRRMGGQNLGFISSRDLLDPYGIDDIFFHGKHSSGLIKEGDRVRFLVVTPSRSDRPNSDTPFAIKICPLLREDADARKMQDTEYLEQLR